MSEIDVRYVENMGRVIDDFLAAAADLRKRNPRGPAQDSHAQRDRIAMPQFTYLVDVPGYAALLVNTAGFHLEAFRRTLIEPVPVLAGGTCVRALLESCAFALWILDPEIDATAREQRLVTLRYDHLVEYPRYHESLRREAVVPNEILEAITEQQPAFDAKLKSIEDYAAKIGLEPQRNKQGKVTAVSKFNTSATAIIRETLHEEALYRLLSAIVHGSHWALLESGFQRITEPGDETPPDMMPRTRFESHARIDLTAKLGTTAVMAMAKGIWQIQKYNGWPLDELAQLLERVFDELDIKLSYRFWLEQ